MFNDIKNFFNRLINPPKSLAPGIYFNQNSAKAPYRLHLRVENNGEGVLILNAATVMHLNHTACEYAYHLIQSTSTDQVVADIAQRYQIDAGQVRKDFLNFQEKLQVLISTPDLDPVTVLGINRDEVYSSKMTAPLRLDCALTYQTPEEHNAVSVPLERVRRELLQKEWEQILNKAWNAGIPHVVFTGGEPTLRPDLPDLIQYAENLGMVTGLATDGLRFSEPEYARKVLQAGLDHILMVFEPFQEQAWEAVKDLLNADIFVTLHFTLTDKNQSTAVEVIEKLARLGVKSISLSANSADLKDALNAARDMAAFQEMNLTWDLPVPYSNINPVSLELEGHAEIPAGAGKAWLYVEPDGDVLPAQGMTRVLGNLCTDIWEVIWANAQSTSA